MTDRVPHAERGLRTQYLAVAQAIGDDLYLEMTESQFIGAVLKASGGSLNPVVVRQVYRDLMQDAGLPPLI